MHHDLITISREYGAGASELASLLGSALGWPVLDSQIPVSVATRMGIPCDALEEWDEHAPGFLESIGHSLMLGSPDLLIDPAYARPHSRDVAKETRKLLIDAAEEPPLIIVGHGAQVIFADRPHTLHLRLVAPIADRSRRVMERRSCGEREAAAIAHQVDRDRVHYVREYLGRDLRDPLLYAAVINTGVVAMPDIVSAVLALLGAEQTART